MDASNFGKVAVLMGGRSAEREVSLMSGSGVLNALKSCGVNAIAFDPKEQSITELIAQKFDRVFIALHGRYGEDGSMQGLLEQLQIPYTGPGVMASAIAMDKIMTKKIWLHEGLSTPRYQKINAQTDWDAVIKNLGLPLIVKPAHEGSTIGVTKVSQAEELPKAYELAARYDQNVLVEEFIVGDEVTCPVLNGKALPVIRIVAPEGNYDYQNKYFTDDTKYLCPCGLDSALEKKIQELTEQSFSVLGCRGWGRADLMIRKSDQKPFLLEMNTSPGMTGHSLVPMAAKVAGLPYEDLCLEILRMAQLD